MRIVDGNFTNCPSPQQSEWIVDRTSTKIATPPKGCVVPAVVQPQENCLGGGEPFHHAASKAIEDAHIQRKIHVCGIKTLDEPRVLVFFPITTRLLLNPC